MTRDEWIAHVALSLRAQYGYDPLPIGDLRIVLRAMEDDPILGPVLDAISRLEEPAAE